MAEIKLSNNTQPELELSTPETINIKIGGVTNQTTTDHSQLENLGFDESGHTGFQKELIFDTTPTEGSTNPVTSGGIKSVVG